MKNPTLTILAALAVSPVAAAQAPVKVEITCNDQMTYNLKGFDVVSGQKISLTLKNVGKIPLKTMGHNLVILKPDTPIIPFASKANAAKKSDYIPEEAALKKCVLAHTRLLGGGESQTITFTAGSPGAYPFLCTSPGHFSVKQGIMTVKPKPVESLKSNPSPVPGT